MGLLYIKTNNDQQNTTQKTKKPGYIFTLGIIAYLLQSGSQTFSTLS
jgi:hypothetical protein